MAAIRPRKTAQDPNKIYYQDKKGKTTEILPPTRAQKDAAYKKSRATFVAQRTKYKNTVVPPVTAAEKAAGAARVAKNNSIAGKKKVAIIRKARKIGM